MSETIELRRLEPTGALAVGEPPALVVAILRAAEAGGASRTGATAEDEAEAARAAVRRAFPALSAEDVERALGVELEAAAPTPAWPVTLGLALPLGLGAVWCAIAAVCLFQLVFGVVAMPVLLDPRQTTWDLVSPVEVVVPLVVALVFGAPGAGLLRLRGWARKLAVWLHGLGGLACVALGVATADGASLLLGLVVVGAAVGLRSARTQSWFTDPGRLARAATPWRPYVAAVAALHGVTTALCAVTWAVRFFYRIGPRAAPSPGADLLLRAGELFADQPAPVLLAALLLPLPFLRLGPRHERVALLATVLLGVVFLGSTLGALAADVLRVLGTL